jgi:hypothetical protein
LTERAELSDSNCVIGDVDQGGSGVFKLEEQWPLGEEFFVERGRSNRNKRTRTKTNEPKESGAKALEPSAACPGRRATSPNVDLVVKHFEQRRKFSEQKRLYLRVGDEVSHLRYEEWGTGVVIEIMTSSVPGGTCLARIRFQDGQMRCFNNDLDNEACCYFFGVRRCWDPSHVKNGIRAKFFEMKG